jgi:glycosyl transferase family 25
VTAAAPPDAAAAARGGYEFLNRLADRIFVLTLPRAAPRQARLRERLAGLRHELWNGVDKNDLDRAELIRGSVYDERLAKRLHRHGEVMPLGAIACAIGHRAMHERMLAERWERMLVLEDDVVPMPDLALLPVALGQLPEDWDLCYLGYFKYDRITPALRVKQAAYLGLSALRLMKWTPGEVLRLYPRPFSQNLRRAGLHHCTHAYAVSRAGARKLASAARPIAENVDNLITRLVLRGELNAFITAPRFFDQEYHAGIAPPEGAPGSYISE